MCGIAGVFARPGGAGSLDVAARLAAMNAAQRHRGPDDSGVQLTADGRGGIGNCRLAIRDLSPAGHMPMGNAAGSVWITYNGELYNAAELRSQLEARGYAFRSGSDTEVILHGYETWGEAVVDRLRGIFAFAVLDERGPSPAVFLARDRVGVKPLYYLAAPGIVAFASELKALRCAAPGVAELDPAGLVAYLLLGSVPPPLTIFRGVQALPAAGALTLHPFADGAVPAPRRYWTLPMEGEEGAPAGAPHLVRERLQDAVRSQLVSDVPLGAFLSGGLDSGAIVALMRASTAGTIRTCSMVFAEAAYDEAPYAAAMARAAGTEHYERTVGASDVAAELDGFLRAMDQPTVDGINTYFVSQTAREAGLTVALSGLGGDELFGGYPSTFRRARQLIPALAAARAVPGGATLARRAMDALPRGERWAKLSDALTRPAGAAGAYLVRRGVFAPGEVRALVRDDIWEEARERFDPIRHVEEGAGRDPIGGHFRWTSRAELTGYTHSQLLRDTDVMSMAHSLEVRVPFLDHLLVEEVLKLPAAAHRAGPGPKPLLRAAIGDLLPPEVRDRRGKQGFTFPLQLWLRGPLRARMTGLLENALGSGPLREDAVRRIWLSYEAGRLHWSRPWTLAMLGNEYITAAPRAAAEAVG